MSIVDATVVPEVGEPEPVVRKNHPVRSLALRWVFLGAATITAFFPTWLRLAQEARDGAITEYVFILPVLAGLAAQGIARRRVAELPIHDRQTDNICGGLGLLIAIAVKGLWLPRYADQYALAHLDVLAGVLFVLSGAVLLFGLRPVGRFWSVWVLLLILTPLTYRMIAIALGGSRFAYGSVLVLLAGVAGAIAVGRTWRRGLFGFLTTVAVGLGILRILLLVRPDIPITVLQPVTAIGATSATGVFYYFFTRRGESKRPLSRPVSPMTAKKSTSSAIVIVLATAAMLALPLPPKAEAATTVGPPGATTEPLLMPSGWTETAVQQYSWVKSFFGQKSTLVRQTLVAGTGNPDWDIESRPRTVVVDTLSTPNVASLVVYPESTLYRLSDTRTSRVLSVKLGHDVVGSLYTSVDDNLLLTWTKLVFEWVRSGVTQRVTLISVDDHQDTATFPLPAPSMASNVSSSFATFLRGNNIAMNDDADYKDRTLLTSVATGLVSAQWPNTVSMP